MNKIMFLLEYKKTLITGSTELQFSLTLYIYFMYEKVKLNMPL